MTVTVPMTLDPALVSQLAGALHSRIDCGSAPQCKKQPWTAALAMQMRIEVPGLAAEKMGGVRGGSGLDHLTTVSSYQDSLMFTSAPADLAHGPDGKGPELEAVHLESMSNLSEGHMPRAHAHDRHTGGDSTGDLALAHYDECAPPHRGLMRAWAWFGSGVMPDPCALILCRLST